MGETRDRWSKAEVIIGAIGAAGSIAIPIMLFVVGNRIAERQAEDSARQLQADRVERMLGHLASTNADERRLAINVVKYFSGTGQAFPEDLIPVLIEVASTDPKEDVAASASARPREVAQAGHGTPPWPPGPACPRSRPRLNVRAPHDDKRVDAATAVVARRDGVVMQQQAAAAAELPRGTSSATSGKRTGPRRSSSPASWRSRGSRRTSSTCRPRRRASRDRATSTWCWARTEVAGNAVRHRATALLARARDRRWARRRGVARVQEGARFELDRIALGRVVGGAAGEHDGAVGLAAAVGDARLTEERLRHADRAGGARGRRSGAAPCSASSSSPASSARSATSAVRSPFFLSASSAWPSAISWPLRSPASPWMWASRM